MNGPLKEENAVARTRATHIHTHTHTHTHTHWVVPRTRQRDVGDGTDHDRPAQEVTPSLNISRVMDMWTRQTGYPVLTCRRQDDRLLVSQSRFLTDPTNASRSAVRPSPYDYKWDVPVCYRTDTADPPSLVWLRHEDDHGAPQVFFFYRRFVFFFALTRLNGMFFFVCVSYGEQ